MSESASTQPSWSLRFLGVGSALAPTLGSASVVLERDGEPLLMVDCGQEALSAFLDLYGRPPSALFVTHAHLDHVAGFERLFARNYFDAAGRQSTRLFVPVTVLPVLHGRVAEYPNPVAEGGANFWDAFRVIPVSYGFWHEQLWFNVFAARHHMPLTAFGLCLSGAFLFTGDTRPIPELLASYASSGMPLVHDCDLIGNPSHTGLPELLRAYPPELREQMIVYHYGSVADGEQLASAGLRVARPGDVIDLPAPLSGSAALEQATRRRLGMPAG